jgi:hypothetical protein
MTAVTQPKVKKLPFVTGFCSAGFHEGTKPKAPIAGTPVKVCTFWQTCPCECHVRLTAMFTQTEMERMPVENPDWEYHPPTFWMPDDEYWAERNQSRVETTSEDNAAVLVQSDNSMVAPYKKRDFTPTETGRAARGQLEQQVKEMCDQWIESRSDEYCTPPFVSTRIAEQYNIKPPSTGAIGAVFKRWQDLGFALIGQKPVRFAAYTPDGLKLGLDGMKAKAKRRG